MHTGRCANTDPPTRSGAAADLAAAPLLPTRGTHAMQGAFTSAVTGLPVVRLPVSGLRVVWLSDYPTAIAKMPIAPVFTVADRVMLATVFELSTAMVCEKT